LEESYNLGKDFKNSRELSWLSFGNRCALLFLVLPRPETSCNQKRWKNYYSNPLLPVCQADQADAARNANILSSVDFRPEPSQNKEGNDEQDVGVFHKEAYFPVFADFSF